MDLPFEVFALRDNEKLSIEKNKPTEGRFIAVMVHDVEMPEGNRVKYTADGTLVEQAAILSCEWNFEHQAWQWLALSVPTKEVIGDLLLDNVVDYNKWYYLTVKDLSI